MKIAIIGFGNLGRAFAEGLIARGLAGKEDIIVCAKSDETLKRARREYGGRAYGNVEEAVKDCGLVVLAVKADVFFEIARTCDGGCFYGKRVLSLMAGVTSEKIKEALRFDGEVVRAMPNLAIAGGNGIIGYTKTEDKELVSLFEGLGLAFAVCEADIEKVTAYLACGLGFAAYVLDCFVEAGKALGLDERLCREVAARNFINADGLGDLSRVVSAVATKGGATERGLEFFEEKDLRGIIGGAVKRAYERLRRE